MCRMTRPAAKPCFGKPTSICIRRKKMAVIVWSGSKTKKTGWDPIVRCQPELAGTGLRLLLAVLFVATTTLQGQRSNAKPQQCRSSRLRNRNGRLVRFGGLGLVWLTISTGHGGRAQGDTENDC